MSDGERPIGAELVRRLGRMTEALKEASDETGVTPERLEAAGWRLVPALDGGLLFAEIVCGFTSLTYYEMDSTVVAERDMGEVIDECVLGTARTMEQLTAVVDAIRGLHEERQARIGGWLL